MPFGCAKILYANPGPKPLSRLSRHSGRQCRCRRLCPWPSRTLIRQITSSWFLIAFLLFYYCCSLLHFKFLHLFGLFFCWPFFLFPLFSLHTFIETYFSLSFYLYFLVGGLKNKYDLGWGGKKRHTHTKAKKQNFLFAVTNF